MSDPTRGGMDDALRRSFRLAAQEEFQDWTFSSELRGTVQRQARQQARVSVWTRTGRMARDAGWLVAAAAMVFILSGRGGLHLGESQAPSGAAASTPAPAASTAAPDNQTTSLPSAPTTPTTSGSMSADNPPASAKALAPSTQGPMAPAPAPEADAASTGAAPVGAAAAPATAPGTATADSTGQVQVAVAQDAQPPAPGKMAPRGIAPGAPEGRALSFGGTTEATLVQSLPMPVPTKAQAVAKNLTNGEQGLALQALPNALILYVKTPAGPAVRSLNLDLQEQWSDNLDPLAVVPTLQPHGSQVIGRYTLVSQEGQFLLYDETGTIRVRLTAGEGVTLRGVRLTGDRWLTLVGKTGADTAIWVADLGEMRLLNAVRLSGQAVDAVALDAVHVAAIDATGNLQLISLQP